MTTETIKEAVTSVSETVQEARRTVCSSVEHAGATSEDALHCAADTVRKSADAIDSLAETTGRKFASAASFLQPSADGCTMMDDVRKMVMRHPGACLMAAAAVVGAIGFMAGSGASKIGNGRSDY